MCLCLQRPGRSERPERSGLSRTHSLRAHGLSGAVEEGLKRVCSAPQLSDPEKGTLLKRKLSVSEPGPGIAYSHGSKYKKHGGKSNAFLTHVYTTGQCDSMFT